MKSNISRWGNSLAIRLPKQAADAAGLQEGAEVEITVDEGKLTIASRRPTYRLSELLQGYKPRHRHAEADWGKPKGKESW